MSGSTSIAHALPACALLCLIGCANNPTPSWSDTAEAYVRADDLPSAIAITESAMHANPEDPYYPARLAALLKAQGDDFFQREAWTLADDRYQRANLLGGPDFPSPEQERRHAHVKTKLDQPWPDIALHLERAWRADADPQCLHRLALGWDDFGDSTAAMEYYQHLVELPSPPPHLQLRLAALRIQHQDFDRAAETLTALLTQQPDSPSALALLAQCHEARGHLDDAHQLFQKIAEQNPDKAAPWRQLADFCQRHGRSDCLQIASQQLEALSPQERKLRPLR